MTMNQTGIGSTWQYGLPPGVYEEKQQTNIKQDVRMDVAAFVGLTERGPVSCPVVVESWDEYVSFFGRSGGGRLLADSVRLFFSNGGRRCVVIRSLDYENVATTLWHLPQLHSVNSYLPLQLQARNPGRWGDQLLIQLSFQYDPMIVKVSEKTQKVWVAGKQRDIKSTQIICNSSTPIHSGSIIIFDIFDEENNKTLVTRFVTAVEVIEQKNETELNEEQKLLTLDREISHQALIQKEPRDNNEIDKKEYFQAQHILINLTLKLEQKGAIPKQENWQGLAFHPDHPRYLPRIINRKNASEVYVDDSEWNNNDVALDAIEQSLLPELDTRATGSDLIRFSLDQEYSVLIIDNSILNDNNMTSSHTLSNEPTIGFNGHDAALSTTRDHFFTAPNIIFNDIQRKNIVNDGMFPFAKQAEPLKALATYDDRNELEPVSLINFPDLLHPQQYEHALKRTPEIQEAETCFSVCKTQQVVDHNLIQTYPNLLNGGSSTKQELSVAQKKIIEYCEIQQDRIAILDLPIGLTAGEIVNWKRSMQSNRAALYSPYIELNQDDINPLIVPPGGAVCGLIARQENQSEVHIAPANILVNTIAKLYDEKFLPDPGFLHQERINALREEPDGFRLMGSRTTSPDSQWTHISVRRLVDYLERQLVIDTNWAVFEVNNYALWNRIYSSVDKRLYAIFNTGGFIGSSTQDSYFIRCDEVTNTQSTLDDGQLIIIVGIAPSVPSEFIVFRLIQGSDGLNKLEELHG